MVHGTRQFRVPAANAENALRLVLEIGAIFRKRCADPGVEDLRVVALAIAVPVRMNVSGG
jgi:hypothetical protein